MRLWLVLFLSLTPMFAAAVFVWWRVQTELRKQRAVRSIALTIVPRDIPPPTTLLIKRPTPRGALASLFRREGGFVSGKAGFVILTLGMAVVGMTIGTRFTGVIGPSAIVICGLAGGSIPRIYRAKQRNKRMLAIEEQFPDALDFVSRSVRAGNAFSISLELLAGEAAEPLKSEILKLTREVALGSGLEDALRGLVERVPLFEVRFFVAAVLLQRETGGNLAEVLGKLAIAVRERLRLRGQVKAASGQGRLTAAVLTCLPVATVVMLKILSPAYMDAMTNDPLGRSLLAGAVVSQILGYLVIQRIIRIEV